jgi:phosphotransferase system enzyme I (PtsI)
MTTTTSTSVNSTADSTTATLSGIGVGRGSAVGSVVKLAAAARPPKNEPPAADTAAADTMVAGAFNYVANNLRVRAAAAQAATAAVLEATSLMAQDPGLLADVQRRIAAGTGPATAVDQAVEGFCKILEASGPYLAERVTDLRDVRDRIVAKVLGVPEPGIPPLSKPPTWHRPIPRPSTWTTSSVSSPNSVDRPAIRRSSPHS